MRLLGFSDIPQTLLLPLAHAQGVSHSIRGYNVAPFKPDKSYSSGNETSHRHFSRGQGHAGPRGQSPRGADQDRPFRISRPAHDEDESSQNSIQDGIRLNKFLAGTGLCSRRKADELIAQGRVTINGKTAQAGDRVQATDTVRVDGEKLTSEEERVVLMLHKPVEVVSTASDPQGRRTVLDLVPQRYRHLRLFPVGRLDYYSEGLILLTNMGELAQRLMHPSHSQHKVYKVLVRGPVSDTALSRMRGGMTLAEGDVTAPAGVEATDHGRDTLLTITLQQGLNRQIRRMCRDCGLTVLKLRRVAEAGLKLGNLPVGETRPLSQEEVAALMQGHASRSPQGSGKGSTKRTDKGSAKETDRFLGRGSGKNRGQGHAPSPARRKDQAETPGPRRRYH